MNSIETDNKYSTALIEELEELGNIIQKYLSTEKVNIEQIEIVRFLNQHINRYSIMNVEVKLSNKIDNGIVSTEKKILEKILQIIIENDIKYSVGNEVTAKVSTKQYIFQMK